MSKGVTFSDEVQREGAPQRISAFLRERDTLQTSWAQLQQNKRDATFVQFGVASARQTLDEHKGDSWTTLSLLGAHARNLTSASLPNPPPEQQPHPAAFSSAASPISSSAANDPVKYIRAPEGQDKPVLHSDSRREPVEVPMGVHIASGRPAHLLRSATARHIKPQDDSAPSLEEAKGLFMMVKAMEAGKQAAAAAADVRERGLRAQLAMARNELATAQHRADDLQQNLDQKLEDAMSEYRQGVQELRAAAAAREVEHRRMKETLEVCLVRIQEYELKEAGPKPHELMRLDLEKKKNRTVARWLKGMEKREYATYFSFWKQYIRFCRIRDLDEEVQRKDSELEAGQMKLKECQKELADERRRRAYDAADVQSTVNAARAKTQKLAVDALWKLRVKRLLLGSVWSGWEQAVAKRRFLTATTQLCLRRALHRRILGCFRCWQALAERMMDVRASGQEAVVLARAWAIWTLPPIELQALGPDDEDSNKEDVEGEGFKEYDEDPEEECESVGSRYIASDTEGDLEVEEVLPTPIRPRSPQTPQLTPLMPLQPVAMPEQDEARFQSPTSNLGPEAPEPDVPLSQPSSSLSSSTSAVPPKQSMPSSWNPVVVDIEQSRNPDVEPPSISPTNPLVVEIEQSYSPNVDTPSASAAKPMVVEIEQSYSPNVDPPSASAANPVVVEMEQSRTPDVEPHTTQRPSVASRRQRARVSKPPKARRQAAESTEAKMQSLEKQQRNDTLRTHLAFWRKETELQMRERAPVPQPGPREWLFQSMTSALRTAATGYCWEQALRARLEVLTQDMLDLQDSMLDAVGEEVLPEARAALQSRLDHLHHARRAYRADAFLATWDSRKEQQPPVDHAHADGWLPTDFLKTDLPQTAEELTGSPVSADPWEGGDAVAALKWVQKIAMHVLSGRTAVAWVVPRQALSQPLDPNRCGADESTLATWRDMQALAAEVLLGMDATSRARSLARMEPRQAAPVLLAMDAADLGLNLQAMHLDHALALLRQFPLTALGQAFTAMSPKAAALICQMLSVELSVKVFDTMEPKDAVKVLETMTRSPLREYALLVLQSLPLSTAANLMTHMLKKRNAGAFLAAMHPSDSAKIVTAMPPSVTAPMLTDMDAKSAAAVVAMMEPVYAEGTLEMMSSRDSGAVMQALITEHQHAAAMIIENVVEDARLLHWLEMMPDTSARILFVDAVLSLSGPRAMGLLDRLPIRFRTTLLKEMSRTHFKATARLLLNLPPDLINSSLAMMTVPDMGMCFGEMVGLDPRAAVQLLQVIPLKYSSKLTAYMPRMQLANALELTSSEVAATILRQLSSDMVTATVVNMHPMAAGGVIEELMIQDLKGTARMVQAMEPCHAAQVVQHLMPEMYGALLSLIAGPIADMIRRNMTAIPTKFGSALAKKRQNVIPGVGGGGYRPSATMSGADSMLHTFHRKRAMQPQMLGNNGTPMLQDSRSGPTSPDTSSPRRPENNSSPKQSFAEPLSLKHGARSRSLRYFEQSTMIPEMRHIQRGIMQSFLEESETSPHFIDNPLRGDLSPPTSSSKSPPRASFERPRSAMPRQRIASPPKPQSTMQIFQSRPRSSEVKTVESSPGLEPHVGTTIGPWTEDVQTVESLHSIAGFKIQSLASDVQLGCENVREPSQSEKQNINTHSSQGRSPRFSKQRPFSMRVSRAR